MQIIENKTNLSQIPQGCCLTIGNFDGVHIGHKLIVATAKKFAAQKNCDLVAMTFEPHPVAVLYPEKATGVLTCLKLKERMLADLGIDYLVVLKDNLELLTLTAQQFIDEFLMKAIKPSLVVEGYDFNFGAGRAGNVETLKSLGLQKGFDVSIIPDEEITLSTGHTVKVSSTTIRYMLESGHVADAAALLGRPYRLIGKIIPGRGKGKQLGFPTLNMERPNQIIPAEGVYAGFVELSNIEENVFSVNDKIPAVFSIGQTRTFGDEYPLLIEAHLLIDNAEKFKGKWMAMDLVKLIRNQHKFKTEMDLTKQISEDCQKAKEILSA